MAESFGTDVERYDRARPRYPDDLVNRIVAASPGPELLDIGCGTGIEARQFRAAGCTVLGVEPDARMAEFARRDGLEVEVSTFETWAPAGRTFDAVVAGQAWHWIDPVAGAAKAAQVLRAGGLLAPFWHVFQPPQDVADAQLDAYRRLVPDSPLLPAAAASSSPAGASPVGASASAASSTPGAGTHRGLLERFENGIRQAGGFGDPQQWQFAWERPYTRAEWLDLLPTTGGLTQLPPEQVAEILDCAGAAIDARGGTIVVQFTTTVLAATRLGPA